MRLSSIQHKCARQIAAFSEHWIGWSLPPVRRAVEDAQWTPDCPAMYCRRCGDSVGPGESTETGCATCRIGGELEGGIGDATVRLGPYAGDLRQWVRAIKFQRWGEMGRYLGRLLGETIRETSMVVPGQTVVVPVPSPWQRRWFRGIDHARVIAEGVSQSLGSPTWSMLVKRDGLPQVKLSPTERRRHGGRGMRLKRGLLCGRVRGLQVVLVDDVRTTGATLRGAVRLLRRQKPDRICCAVLAVSDARARLDRAHQAARSSDAGTRPGGMGETAAFTG